MTKGLDQILSRLNELQVKAPKAARAAVGEGADEVEKILKVNTPVYFVLGILYHRLGNVSASL